MIRNQVKIKESKTKFLIENKVFNSFNSYFIVFKQSFDDLNIMVGDNNIVSSNSARNLGVIFDKCMKHDYHISVMVNLFFSICVTLVVFVVFYLMMHVPN